MSPRAGASPFGDFQGQLPTEHLHSDGPISDSSSSQRRRCQRHHQSAAYPLTARGKPWERRPIRLDITISHMWPDTVLGTWTRLYPVASTCPSGRERGPVFTVLSADAQNAHPSAGPRLRSSGLSSFHSTKRMKFLPGAALCQTMDPSAGTVPSERARRAWKRVGDSRVKKPACPLPLVLCRKRPGQRQGWGVRPRELADRSREEAALWEWHWPRVGGWGGTVTGRRGQAADGHLSQGLQPHPCAGSIASPGGPAGLRPCAEGLHSVAGASVPAELGAGPVRATRA